jgi:hypothetical protein
MATIKARKQANGATRYTAIVPLRGGKTIIHRESKTFTFRAAAFSWAKHREVELEKPGALEQAQQEEFSLAGLKHNSLRRIARLPWEWALLHLRDPSGQCRLWPHALSHRVLALHVDEAGG